MYLYLSGTTGTFYSSMDYYLGPYTGIPTRDGANSYSLAGYHSYVDEAARLITPMILCVLSRLFCAHDTPRNRQGSVSVVDLSSTQLLLGSSFLKLYTEWSGLK